MSSDAYFDDKHADHGSTVEKVNALGKQIFGEGPADEDGVGGAERPLYHTISRPHLPSEVEAHWSDADEDILRKVSHAAGLTDKQFAPFMHELEKRAVADHQARVAAKRRCHEVLKGEWKESFDQKLNLAREALGQFPDLKEALHVSGVGNHPDIVRAFHALGEAMRERGQLVHDVDGTLSDDQAKKELQRAMRSDPYLNSNHPRHRQVVENVNKLARRVYGEQPVGGDD